MSQLKILIMFMLCVIFNNNNMTTQTALIQSACENENEKLLHGTVCTKMTINQ